MNTYDMNQIAMITRDVKDEDVRNTLLNITNLVRDLEYYIVRLRVNNRTDVLQALTDLHDKSLYAPEDELSLENYLTLISVLAMLKNILD